MHRPRSRVVGLATAVAVAVTTVAVAAPAQAASRLTLARIQYDSPGRDTRSNSSLNAEYVTVHNRSTVAVSLRGYTVRDAARHVYTFGSLTLRPGRSVLVHTGRGTNTGANRYWGSRAYIWNDDKDTATLRTSHGTTIDTCSWRSHGHGYNLC